MTDPMAIDLETHSEYEITWQNGHTERITAWSVAWPNDGTPILGVDPGHIKFYGRVDGRIELLLAAQSSQILSIRNVGVDEQIAPPV